MGMNNQNRCEAPCVTSAGTFYLAKIAPQYAGKTLVIELYDAGDSTGAGYSDVYPMKPSPTTRAPSSHVPAADCTCTATPDPNDPLSDGGDLPSGEDPDVRTGVRFASTDQAPNAGDRRRLWCEGDRVERPPVQRRVATDPGRRSPQLHL